MLPNEKILVDQARQGDHTALSAIVKHYSPRIYNLALRLTRNKADAEDVLQETFLTMMRKIETFEGRSSIYTWLYRVATNAALEKLRDKHHKHVTVSLDDPNYEGLGQYEPIELPDFTDHKLPDKKFQTFLARALEELNEKLRAVFILRDIEGNSVAETAKILGITQSNVKVRTMRARLMLRDLLTGILKEEGWA